MKIAISITVYPDTGDSFRMTFFVPADRDAEEYIDEMLDQILSKDYSISEWEFD